jgi:lipoate-protein ligase A
MDQSANLTDLLGRRPDPDLIKRNLTEAFESEFNVEFQEGDLTLTEHARYQVALAEIDTPDWIDLVRRPASDMPLYESVQKFAGGMLRASLAYDRITHRIRQVGFSGDIFVNPRRTIADLEAALRATSVERVEHNVRVFFAGREVDMLALTPDDFIAVIRLAVQQPIVASSRS